MTKEPTGNRIDALSVLKVPDNRTWRLSKEERKLAHKFLVQQSKLKDLNLIENMTLSQYYEVILTAMKSICDKSGNFIDIFDGKTLYNLHTKPQENVLRRIMDGRSLFHSIYPGDTHGLLNDINHNDPEAFKEWVCNAHWGGHPYETMFGDFVPYCICNDGQNFSARLKRGEKEYPSLEVEYSDKWILVFSTSHRDDVYAMRCFLHLRKLGYPVVWDVNNDRDRRLLTKMYMVENEKQPRWWDMTVSDFERNKGRGKLDKKDKKDRVKSAHP